MEKTLNWICKDKIMRDKQSALGQYLVQTDCPVDDDHLLRYDILHSEWDQAYCLWMYNKQDRKLERKLDGLYKQELKLAKKIYTEIFNIPRTESAIVFEFPKNNWRATQFECDLGGLILKINSINKFGVYKTSYNISGELYLTSTSTTYDVNALATQDAVVSIGVSYNYTSYNLPDIFKATKGSNSKEEDIKKAILQAIKYYSQNNKKSTCQ